MVQLCGEVVSFFSFSSAFHRRKVYKYNRFEISYLVKKQQQQKNQHQQNTQWLEVCSVQSGRRSTIYLNLKTCYPKNTLTSRNTCTYVLVLKRTSERGEKSTSENEPKNLQKEKALGFLKVHQGWHEKSTDCKKVNEASLRS